MKAIFAGVVLALVLVVTGAAAEKSLNQGVVDFCVKHTGEKVGDGESTTLAAMALKAAGAQGRGKDSPQPGDLVWGKYMGSVTSTGDKLLGDGIGIHLQPGDIVQFRDCEFVNRERTGKVTVTYDKHTAIIYKVSKYEKTVTAFHPDPKDKKVTTFTFNIGNLKKGTIRYYRPQSAEIVK
jgi:hypothetical protein